MNFKKNFKRFFTLSRNAEGFTLVELIVVIAILGILSVVAVPAYGKYVDSANKAVDEQSLSMMNTAFAAACAYIGVDPVNANVTLNWSDAKTFTGLSQATTRSGATENVASVFNESLNLPSDAIVFKKYNSGNVRIHNGQFVGPNSTLSGAYNTLGSNSAFMDSIQTQIAAVQGSAFAGMGADRLLGQVTNVADMAADFIYNKGEGSTLTGVVMSEEYIATMAGMLGKTPDALKAELETMFTEDPEAFSKYMANSTVLNVANTMNSMTAEKEATTKNNLATLNFGNLATTLSENPEEGLAQAALLYGMYTAFDPAGAKDLVDTQNVSALMSLGEKKNGSGQTFAEYIAQVNTEGSQAAKDYAGYKSALDIVYEGASSSTDVANQAMANGYGDSELAGLLTGIIGNGSTN